jgi:hypothetical protein
MYESPEVAAPYSTGGFSNYFGRPPYQNDSMSEYFYYFLPENAGLYKWVLAAIHDLILTCFPYFCTLYSASGRGIPDISAASFNIMDVYLGDTNLDIGTDAAAAVRHSTSFVHSRVIELIAPCLDRGKCDFVVE